MELTVDYLKTRVQFGRPIASFQAIQHRLADLHVMVEAARAVSYAAVRGRTPAEVAKVYCSETLAQVATAKGLPAPTVIPGVQRGMPVPDAAASEAIFAAVVPAAGKVTPGKVVLTGGNVVLFTVDKVTPGDIAAMPAAQRDQMRDQLARIAAEEELQSLVKSLRKDMKVKLVEQNL